MRIVNSTFITLDGVTERLPEWHFPFHDASADALALEQLRRADAMLMGRRTYEVYADAWPDRAGEYADRLNALPKHVASTTLRDPQWSGASVIAGDLVDAVRELRARPGGDVLMHGFGPVARTLVRHGLLDELHLWVHPVLAGRAEPDELIFREGVGATFRHAGTTVLDSGVVVLTSQSIVNGS